jgi:hypothetical protein
MNAGITRENMFYPGTSLVNNQANIGVGMHPNMEAIAIANERMRSGIGIIMLPVSGFLSRPYQIEYLLLLLAPIGIRINDAIQRSGDVSELHLAKGKGKSVDVTENRKNSSRKGKSSQ